MGKVKIIVVDDSAMTRKFYKSILAADGYDVKDAEDGYAALEMLYVENFDLIITDINMPRMDGFEFIKEVRSQPDYREKPIIVMTTQDHQQDLERGIKLGADLYFIKPTEIEQLLNKVRGLIQGAT